MLESADLNHPKDNVRRTRELLAGMAFNRLLGFEIARVHRDGLTLRCKVRKELLNSAGALHGGVAASLADTAVGMSLHHHFAGTRPVTTVELKLNYFRPVTQGHLFARARLVRIGSTLCVGRVDFADDGRRSAGMAIVTYMFIEARKVTS